MINQLPLAYIRDHINMAKSIYSANDNTLHIRRNQNNNDLMEISCDLFYLHDLTELCTIKWEKSSM